MQVTNQVHPTEPGQIEKVMESGPQGPIVMANPLKFKDRAEYKDGHDTSLTGREAYMLYANAVTDIIQECGGRVLFGGDVTHLSLGIVDDLWDEVALAEYPNRGAMVAMSQSPAFAAAGVHRVAGLEGQLNIETTYSADLPQILNRETIR